MKERHLKVFEIDKEPTSTDLYVLSTYPHDGLFQFPSGMVYMRNSGVVTYVGMPSRAMFAEREAPPVSSQITMNDLLKVIAINQNPDLIMGLCE